MPIKVAFIGAGSDGFTRGLLRDILTVPELQDTRFALTDIDRKTLEMAAALCRKDIRENKLPARVDALLDRRQALEGADYVISGVRIGGLAAMEADIEIPLKYGVDQGVGDTLCAGGIMYGQRNVAAILDFCKDLREVSKPGVLFLNYANPNAMNTWAANHYGKVNTVGLCHGVMDGHKLIAEVIQFLVNAGRGPSENGFVRVGQKDVDIICAGINHQTWYTQVRYNGEDWTGRLLEGFQKHPSFSRTEKVRVDVLKRFGFFSTESNGHLSEYLSWYRKRQQDIPRWIDLSSGGGMGATGACLRGYKNRRSFRAEFNDAIKRPVDPITPASRGYEHGSYIIESLETGRVYRGHFNVVNNGCITNLPDDAIVELPGYVDRNGISIPRIGRLPSGCAAVCNASISVQRLAVEAAVGGDVMLLKQAMMMDPLTGAVCDPDEISQMTDEMLAAQAKWLPQYRGEIRRAKARLAEAKRLGLYRGTNTSKGGALLTDQTAEQVANAWARTENAVILRRFTTTALQPATNIRNASIPAADLFTNRLEVKKMGNINGFADVRAVHRSKDGVIFLRTEFHARATRRGRLIYGADGPIKAWINGTVAGCHPQATNPAIAGQYHASTRWKKGLNDVVFALATNMGNAWGLFAAAGGKNKHTNGQNSR